MTSQEFVGIIICIATVVVIVTELALPRARRRTRRNAVAAESIDSAALNAIETIPAALLGAYLEPSAITEKANAAIEFEHFIHSVSDNYSSDKTHLLNHVPSGQSTIVHDSENVSITQHVIPIAISPVEIDPMAEAPDAGSTSWIATYNSAIGDLSVSARAAFVNVLETISTTRAVDAIASAAANDPDQTIRVAALTALAHLVELDGGVWAESAASAARLVIAHRPKGGDDVARARSLLATVDVVIYED